MEQNTQVHNDTMTENASTNFFAHKHLVELPLVKKHIITAKKAAPTTSANARQTSAGSVQIKGNRAAFDKR